MFEGIPEPPDHLDEAVRDIWRAYAPVYAIRVSDMPLFEGFCVSFDMWRRLVATAAESGLPIPPRADKEFANYRVALGQMLRLRQPGMPDEPTENYQPTLSIEEQRANLLAVVEEEIERGKVTSRNRRDSGRAKPKAPVAKKQSASNGRSRVRTEKGLSRRKGTTEEPQES